MKGYKQGRGILRFTFLIHNFNIRVEDRLERRKEWSLRDQREGTAIACVKLRCNLSQADRPSGGDGIHVRSS